ncbi:hypothetical protein [Streptomyces mirabilis]
MGVGYKGNLRFSIGVSVPAAHTRNSYACKLIEHAGIPVVNSSRPVRASTPEASSRLVCGRCGAGVCRAPSRDAEGLFDRLSWTVEQPLILFPDQAFVASRLSRG